MDKWRGRKPQSPEAEHIRELLCQLATLNKENEAIRKYMEWQTQRINSLEMRLITLGTR